MAVGNRKQDCLDCLKGHPSQVGTEAYFRKNNLVFFEWKTSSKVFFTQVFSSHNCHEIVSGKKRSTTFGRRRVCDLTFSHYVPSYKTSFGQSAIAAYLPLSLSLFFSLSLSLSLFLPLSLSLSQTQNIGIFKSQILIPWSSLGR